MLKRTLQTGNLSAALAASAQVYESKPAFEAVAPEGTRWCFVGFKVTSKMLEAAKTAEIVVNSNFAVAVPIAQYDAENDKHISFLAALAQDYQDSIIVASANKETAVDPTDLDRLIDDYLSTERNRLVPTKKQMLEWFDADWVPAYICRVIQKNEADGKETTTEAQMHKVINAYKGYLSAILPKECMLDRVCINGVRQSTEKLIELELLAPGAEASHLIDCCKRHMQKTVQQLVAEV